MKKYFMFMFIMLMGCSPSASFDSLPDAKTLADKFFTDFKSGEYKKLDKLYSEEFWAAMPRETWHKILPNINNELGNINECELVNWNQQTQATTDRTGNFVVLNYQCDHEKYESLITFTVMKPLSGGKSKIVGQNFSSIGLLIE